MDEKDLQEFSLEDIIKEFSENESATANEETPEQAEVETMPEACEQPEGLPDG